MINRLHPCPSYSCMLELEEKPSSKSFSIISPRVALPVRSGLSTADAPCYRSQSPLSVIINNNDTDFEVPGHYGSDVDENDIDDRDMINLRSSVSIDEPLHDTSGQKWTLPKHSGASHVNFSPKVAVSLIPSHKDYTWEMKDRIWTSMEQIRVNAVKRRMELYLSGAGDDDYHEKLEDEPKFVPLGSLKRTRGISMVPSTCWDEMRIKRINQQK